MFRFHWRVCFRSSVFGGKRIRLLLFNFAELWHTQQKRILHRKEKLKKPHISPITPGITNTKLHCSVDRPNECKPAADSLFISARAHVLLCSPSLQSWSSRWDQACWPVPLLWLWCRCCPPSPPASHPAGAHASQCETSSQWCGGSPVSRTEQS